MYEHLALRGYGIYPRQISMIVKCITLFSFLLLFTSSTELPLNKKNDMVEGDIAIGEVTNDIRMGPFAGNRNISFGVKNILEEILMDLDFDLTDRSNRKINVRLVFFDVKNIGTSVGFYHKDLSVTEIIAQGELVIDGKVKKRTIQKGQSKQITTSTLIVGEDGTFNQQTASIALKKLCKNIIEDLLL